MNVLGLITARGGSKGIPGKNLYPLRGQPLLFYTCDAARKSKRLTRVLLSTDDSAIAEAGKSFGVEVPFLRPAALAQDTTPSLEVALQALAWLRDHERWSPDALMLLQPTSPLRTAAHIDESLDLLAEKGAGTVVSVVEVPHRYSPYSLLRLAEGRLVDFWEGPLTFDRFRRQNHPVLFARNGPVVLGVRISVLSEGKSFYGAHVIPYFMNEEDSIDIDNLADIRKAEAILAARAEGAS